VNTLNPDNVINIYIAGHKTSEGTGSGLKIIQNSRSVINKKLKLSNYCTAFQTKLKAIETELSLILNTNQQNQEMIINLCDESVLKALKNKNTTNSQIYNIYDIYHKLLDNNNKLFVRKINSTDENYKQVKQIAMQSLTSHNAIVFDKISKTTLKRIIYEKNISDWNERWEASESGSDTKTIFNTLYKRLEIERYFNTDFYVSQIITNHGKFGQYLKRFHVRDNDLCENCGQGIDNRDHRIYDCIKYDNVRQEFRQLVESNCISWPSNPYILIKSDFKSFSNFCKYILDE
jgi:hypothetical protein